MEPRRPPRRTHAAAPLIPHRALMARAAILVSLSVIGLLVFTLMLAATR